MIPVEHVKILHTIYEIRTCEKKRVKHWGSCNRRDHVITISVHQSGAFLHDTVMHEVLHAAYYLWGMDKKSNEERTVGWAATAWTTILFDNPQFARWMDNIRENCC